MAEFIWDPEVQWPPPAHILLNYDVVPPAAGREIATQSGVLRSVDVVQHTYGGVRTINVVPPAELTKQEDAMSIGDKSAQSYGWGVTLDHAVPDGEGIKIPTPGFDLSYTDTEHAEVSVGQRVFKHSDDSVSLVFDKADVSSVDVTNGTGAEWPIGDTVYVFCPHLLAEGNNEWDLKGQIWDLQQRVVALEEVSGVTRKPAKAKEAEPAPKAHANHHADNHHEPEPAPKAHADHHADNHHKTKGK